MPVGKFLKKLILGKRSTELGERIREGELKHGFYGSIKPKRLPLRTTLLQKRAWHLKGITETGAKLAEAFDEVSRRLEAIGVRDKHKLARLPQEISLHGYLLSFLPAIAGNQLDLQKKPGERLIQVGLDANDRFHLILHRSATGVKATIRGVTGNAEVVDKEYEIPFKVGMVSHLKQLDQARDAHEKFKREYEKT